jgi:hypothetical protein
VVVAAVVQELQEQIHQVVVVALVVLELHLLSQDLL